MAIGISKKLLVTTTLISSLMLQACSAATPHKDLSQNNVTDVTMTAVYRGAPDAEARVIPAKTLVKIENIIQPAYAAAAFGQRAMANASDVLHGMIHSAGEQQIAVALLQLPQGTQVQMAADEDMPLTAAANTKSVSDNGSETFANNVTDGELEKNRGTFSPDDALNFNLLNATSTNNATNGQVTTGVNLISSDAFTNAQGVVSLIQNSGNNVIIQSATVVNLTMKP